MRAVIVAAGRGRRLMPLTSEMPKSLIRIHDTPLLEYLLHGLAWAGITDVTIVVRYLGEMIEQAYGGGSSLGMRLTYAWQSGPDGTGSAVLAAERSVGDEPFMLLWGDILTDPTNYRRIREMHHSSPCDLLSCLNWLDDPSTGAGVFVDGDAITSIVEKPPPGTAQTHWNQAGLFVCGKAIFEALRQSDLSGRGEIEFTAGVYNLLALGKDVRWMPLEGFWSDVGTPEALERLNADPAIPSLLK